MNPLSRIACVSALVALSACGGGGDAGSSLFVPPTNDFAVRAAWQNLLAGNASWSVAGVGSDGHRYEMALTLAPGPAAAFPVTGVVASTSRATSVLKRDGSVLGTSLTESFFDAGFALVGLRQSSDVAATSCDRPVAPAVVPPLAAKVGVSGALVSVDVLAGCSASSVLAGTAVNTWSLEFEAGATYFCVNSTDRDLLAPPTVSTESDCIEIEADGALGRRAKVRLSTAGFSLTARN